MRTLKKKCRRKNGGASSAVSSPVSSPVSSNNLETKKKSLRIAQAQAAEAKAAAKAAAEEAAKAKAAAEEAAEAKAAADAAAKAAANAAKSRKGKAAVSLPGRINVVKDLSDIANKLFKTIQSTSSTNEEIKSCVNELVDWYIQKRVDDKIILEYEEKEGIRLAFGMFVIRQIACEITNSSKAQAPACIAIERNAFSDSDKHRTNLKRFWHVKGKVTIQHVFGIDPRQIPENAIPYTEEDSSSTFLLDDDKSIKWESAHLGLAANGNAGPEESRSSHELDSKNCFLALLGWCQKDGPGHSYATSTIVNDNHNNWTRTNSIGVQTGLATSLCGMIEHMIQSIIEQKKSTEFTQSIISSITDFAADSKTVYLNDTVLMCLFKKSLEGKIPARSVATLSSVSKKPTNKVSKLTDKCLDENSEIVSDLALDILFKRVDTFKIEKTLRAALNNESNTKNNRDRFIGYRIKGVSNPLAGLAQRFITNIRDVYSSLLGNDSITAENMYTLQNINDIYGIISDKIGKLIEEKNSKKSIEETDMLSLIEIMKGEASKAAKQEEKTIEELEKKLKDSEAAREAAEAAREAVEAEAKNLAHIAEVATKEAKEAKVVAEKAEASAKASAKELKEKLELVADLSQQVLARTNSGIKAKSARAEAEAFSEEYKKKLEESYSARAAEKAKAEKTIEELERLKMKGENFKISEIRKKQSRKPSNRPNLENERSLKQTLEKEAEEPQIRKKQSRTPSNRPNLENERRLKQKLEEEAKPQISLNSNSNSNSRKRRKSRKVKSRN